MDNPLVLLPILLGILLGGFGMARRLLDGFLSDEAGWPVADVHRVADATEHGLAGEALEPLDHEIGHPRPDTRGDPLSRRRGGEAIAGLNWNWFVGLLGFTPLVAVLAWWRIERLDIRVGR
jgi:Iron dependent repressor, metal binding and dimerisation domain